MSEEWFIQIKLMIQKYYVYIELCIVSLLSAHFQAPNSTLST